MRVPAIDFIRLFEEQAASAGHGRPAGELVASSIDFFGTHPGLCRMGAGKCRKRFLNTVLISESG